MIEGNTAAGRNQGGQNEFMAALKGQESGLNLEQIERIGEALKAEKPISKTKLDGEEEEEEESGSGPSKPNPNHTSQKTTSDLNIKNQQQSQNGVGMDQVLDLELIRKEKEMG